MIWLRRWRSRVPITIKVPIVVVLLMLTIGVVASQLVYTRLVASQERQISDLANAYLDGLVSPLTEPVLRDDSWAIFDILDRARGTYAAVAPIQTVVTDANGNVLAGSDPRRTPIGEPLPSDFPVDRTAASEIILDEAQARAFVDRELVVQERYIGALRAELDVSPLLAERDEVLWTLIVSNTLVTLLLAALGWFAVRRMVAPMKVLAEHLDSAQDGAVEPIADAKFPTADNETARLFRRFNRMARAVSERETLAKRLADEERLASLGRLASGVAHEINNPLGGLFNAIDTLKVHGDKAQVRRNAIDLLERGLRGIRDVVRSALATYRPDKEPRFLQAADVDDLRLLIRSEIRTRHLQLQWRNDLPKEVAVAAFPVRQMVLNLLLNACRAAPESGTVALQSRVAGTNLVIDIDDSGEGMPENIATYLADSAARAPIVDSSGLGLWVARRMATELNGTLSATASDLGGARVRLLIPLETQELSRVA